MALRDAMADSEHHPRYVVWELTLKCDLHCKHCGSRAGKARPSELSKDEALDVVRQLAEAGTAEVTLIGGEAYLAPYWLDVVRALRDAGIRPTMTTGARGVDKRLAEVAAEAGMVAMSVSIDGMEAAHDKLRNLKGSWRKAVDALGHIRRAGMTPLSNTQWNRQNLPDLEQLGTLLADHGARLWQVQITGPMGRANEVDDWLLQPYDMLELVDRLVAFLDSPASGSLKIEAANNLGYFGPHEHRIRRSHWQGCKAGQFVLGIESNGDVKGCPSLPSAPYVGGNLREMSLKQIWNDTPELNFSHQRPLSELWGHCKTCYYAEMCRGGCSWTAHTLLGRRGNMPYCYHRADVLRGKGIREMLTKVEAAPGTPFDFGRFELREEGV